MNFHLCLHISTSMKRFATNFTWKWSVVIVSVHMVFECARSITALLQSIFIFLPYGKILYIHNCISKGRRQNKRNGKTRKIVAHANGGLAPRVCARKNPKFPPTLRPPTTSSTLSSSPSSTLLKKNKKKNILVA